MSGHRAGHHHGAATPRFCLACGGRLETVGVPGSDVSPTVCRNHGTWLARGELNRLAFDMELHRAGDVAAEAEFSEELIQARRNAWFNRYGGR